MLIDTHCHLNFPQLAQDLDAVLERSKAAGVTRWLIPGTDMETAQSGLALAHKYDGIYAAVGIHPTDMQDGAEYDWDTLEQLAQDPKIKAIGEVGLDYFH